MKKLISIGALLLFALFAPAQIELKLSQVDSLTYSVYYKSCIDLTAPLNHTSDGQIVVKAPTGTAEIASISSQIGDWKILQPIISPTEAPEYDYFTFTLKKPSNAFPYQKGREVLLFTFMSKNPIAGSLQLMNKEDAFSPPNSLDVNSRQLLTILGMGFTNAVDDIYGDTMVPALQIKAFLQGPYDPLQNNMRSDLQKEQLIPSLEPYSSLNNPRFPIVDTSYYLPSTITKSTTPIIIDWVFIELRPTIDSVAISRPALLLSNGLVINESGNACSPLEFEVKEGMYYVCLKHRNHLGVMTATPVPVGSKETTRIDFTTPATLTYGEHAQKQIDGVNCLWAGDVNQDGKIIGTGRANDMDLIIFNIVLDENNSNGSLDFHPKRYNATDTNLDGYTRFLGSDSDLSTTVQDNITSFPSNTSQKGNFIIWEQIPAVRED